MTAPCPHCRRRVALPDPEPDQALTVTSCPVCGESVVVMVLERWQRDLYRWTTEN